MHLSNDFNPKFFFPNFHFLFLLGNPLQFTRNFLGKFCKIEYEGSNWIGKSSYFQKLSDFSTKELEIGTTASEISNFEKQRKKLKLNLKWNC